MYLYSRSMQRKVRMQKYSPAFSIPRERIFSTLHLDFPNRPTGALHLFRLFLENIKNKYGAMK